MKTVVLLAAAILMGGQVLPSAAAMQWPNPRYQYSAEGKPLRDVLRDFASSQGMALSMSADIEGVVAGKFDLAPGRFIELMARSYGFSWYFDGVVLHIASAQDMLTKVIKLDTATIGDFRAMVTRMSLAEPRFPIQYDEATNTAIVQGPSPYVGLVVEMGNRLEARSVRHGVTQTRVFALQNARAGDRPSEDGKSPPVKGVATVLRELYASNDAATQRDDAGVGSAMRDIYRTTIGEPLDPMQGLVSSAQKSTSSGGTRAGALLAGKTGGVDVASLPLKSSSSFRDLGKGGDPFLQSPVVLADTSNNAVVIRDLPERMADHEALIRQLDVAPERIEIEVQIIEIQNDALDELGVDWTLRGRRLAGGFSGAQQGSSLATSKGFSMSAVIGNAGSFVLARVGALTRQGKARIVAKPKVATLNQQTAVMSSQQQIHVKVEAFQSAQLYGISAGTQMRVLPSASLQNGVWRIRLDVNVQDGRILNRSVGDIPVVTSNRIDTQAVVADGESLLLAGYGLEEEGDDSNGIPYLSSVPVIGQLFRSDRKSRSNVVRLFLVSPRMLP
ncbi:MAG: EscC/YscC/HrcC family type III secretion system outer membrane ring protein [Comamonadaceae bacterium]|nr:MAG: EscC/YscC/HrcC family type III secretion system outer membrane ring protein [Comamonadaceae bacterium]